jgi:hypothetical protein
LAQQHSFKYNVRKTQDSVEVEVGRYRWSGFLISLLWSILWVVAAAEAYESWWGQTYFGFLFLMVGLLLASFGTFIAVNSVLWRTLILSPSSGLRLRTSFFGVATNKSINLSDVNSFGFGLATHSFTPVLRLELRTPSARTKWVVLASRTTEHEVNAFLQDIEAQGFQLPP